MRPPFFVGKPAIVLLGIGCLVSSGCLCGFALPSISYVAGTDLGDCSDDIHVFRIDVTVSTLSLGRDAGSQYSFREIPVSHGDQFSSQIKGAIDYSWSLNSFSNLWCGKGETAIHTLLVRMYRPGFQTIEVKSWQKDRPAKWLPALSIDEQEKAVDNLLFRNAGDNVVSYEVLELVNDPCSDESNHLNHLVKGCTSEAHQKAIRFGADEYERLAKLAPEGNTGQALRDRLLRKASFLRNKACCP